MFIYMTLYGPYVSIPYYFYVCGGGGLGGGYVYSMILISMSEIHIGLAYSLALTGY